MVSHELSGKRIARIEWARMPGLRPRSAGCNARLGEHGQNVQPPIARITTDDDVSGFGWCRITREQAEAAVGASLCKALEVDTSGRYIVQPAWRPFEYPIYDLLGRVLGKPVYALVSDRDAEPALCVPCYDTSLYMDDLHLTDDGEAAALIAAEAHEGLDRGHRAFKIKVGRGAMHMPLEAGTRRDIVVIHAVRDAVGPDTGIMIDANNGFNLNLAKRILGETADARIHWIEEPFHEDARLYEHLKKWMQSESLDTLIADGEGSASPHLLDWARDGLIDIVQYDVRNPGFSRWLELGPQLDAWGVRSAPHNYGEPYGNYVSCHLAPAIEQFEAVEWDEASVTGLDASGYAVQEGLARAPLSPGFGLELDGERYGALVKESGFVVDASAV